MAELEKSRHADTRALWQEVFAEDSKEFLDYYYTYMADHNRIFVCDEHEDPVSMLHLNPYELMLGENKVKSAYIVAVATRASCRHQGHMTRLLREALQVMAKEQLPLTFLMPASEAIYTPFDFTTVYRQSQLTIREIPDGTGVESWHCVPCHMEQLGKLAEFSNRLLDEKSGMHTVRSEAYYQRIWKEQESMNGEILLFYNDQDPCDLKGYCFTGHEEDTEAWEIAVRGHGTQEEANASAVQALANYFSKTDALPMTVSGFFPGSSVRGYAKESLSYRPLIMIRIVHLGAFVSCLRAEQPVEFDCFVEDPLLEQNHGAFHFRITPEGGYLEKTQDNPALSHLPIADLQRCFFDIERQKCIPSERLRLPASVYINEIV